MPNVRKRQTNGGPIIGGDPSVNTPYPVIDAGNIVSVREFGAVVPAKDHFVLLEWGNGPGVWEIVHAFNCYGYVNIKREFVGDGAKRFRIRRFSENAVTQSSFFWFDWLEK